MSHANLSTVHDAGQAGGEGGRPWASRPMGRGHAAERPAPFRPYLAYSEKLDERCYGGDRGHDHGPELETFTGQVIRSRKTSCRRDISRPSRLDSKSPVKNSQRPDGSKTVWAYYMFSSGVFPSGSGSAPAQPDSACYQCHLEHANDDNVWVQFYPVLQRP